MCAITMVLNKSNWWLKELKAKMLKVCLCSLVKSRISRSFMLSSDKSCPHLLFIHNEFEYCYYSQWKNTFWIIVYCFTPSLAWGAIACCSLAIIQVVFGLLTHLSPSYRISAKLSERVSLSLVTWIRGRSQCLQLLRHSKVPRQINLRF